MVSNTIIVVAVIVVAVAIIAEGTIQIRLSRVYLPADTILRRRPFDGNEVVLTKYRLSIQPLEWHRAPRLTSRAHDSGCCLFGLARSSARQPEPQRTGYPPG